MLGVVLDLRGCEARSGILIGPVQSFPCEHARRSLRDEVMMQIPTRFFASRVSVVRFPMGGVI
jgi:hypothetical protein